MDKNKKSIIVKQNILKIIEFIIIYILLNNFNNSIFNNYNINNVNYTIFMLIKISILFILTYIVITKFIKPILFLISLIIYRDIKDNNNFKLIYLTIPSKNEEKFSLVNKRFIIFKDNNKTGKNKIISNPFLYNININRENFKNKCNKNDIKIYKLGLFYNIFINY